MKLPRSVLGKQLQRTRRDTSIPQRLDPVDPAAMVAQKTHGIARALSEGQVEPEGEYDARSILLTGGAGFIASHVVIRLVQRYPDAKVSWGAALTVSQRIQGFLEGVDFEHVH